MAKLGAGWGTIFHREGEGIALPQELTKIWWDKKKQVVAKTKETGMGEQLTRLKTLFDGLRWPVAQPTAAKLAETVEDCRLFITASKTEALRKQLVTIAKLAQEQSKLMKAGALTKPTGKTLDEIGEAAHEALAALNISNLEKALEVAEKSARLQVMENSAKNIDVAFKTMETVVKKLPQDMKKARDLVKAWQADPTEAKMKEAGNAIHKVSRGMTTPLGTVEKSLGKLSFTVEDAVIRKLLKDFEVFANDPDSNFMIGLRPDQGPEVFNSAALLWARFKKLADTIQVKV